MLERSMVSRRGGGAVTGTSERAIETALGAWASMCTRERGCKKSDESIKDIQAGERVEFYEHEGAPWVNDVFIPLIQGHFKYLTSARECQ